MRPVSNFLIMQLSNSRDEREASEGRGGEGKPDGRTAVRTAAGTDSGAGREAVFAGLSPGEIKIVECLQIYYNTL